MVAAKHRPRVAVVSPFLDKSYGTERMVAEWVSRLTDEFEFHVYCQQVQDLDLSAIVWHRIPKLPGPTFSIFSGGLSPIVSGAHRDRRFRGLQYDLVFSPGVNCLDADAVSIHIVFAEFLHRVRQELKLLQNSVWSWPILVHRRIYYRLIIFLERKVYTNPRTQLILTSGNTAAELERF